MAIREINLGPRSRVIEQGTGAVRDGGEPPVAREAPMVPERAGRAGDQALPVEGDGDVIGSLIRRLEERRRIGVKRYGHPLQAFNGRDAFRDHEEELLDRHNYAEQIRLEYNAVLEALMVLARHNGLPAADRSPESLRAALLLAEKLGPGPERRRLAQELEAARQAERHAAVLLARAQAEVAAMRHNLEQAQQDLSAEQAAVAQMQAELARIGSGERRQM